MKQAVRTLHMTSKLNHISVRYMTLMINIFIYVAMILASIVLLIGINFLTPFCRVFFRPRNLQPMAAGAVDHNHGDRHHSRSHLGLLHFPLQLCESAFFAFAFGLHRFFAARLIGLSRSISISIPVSQLFFSIRV